MVMRAQVSLQFNDEDLFTNLIKPCKEEKSLNSLIIKCLSSYYYNKQSRELIEGQPDMEGVRTSDQIFDEIRNSIAAQSYYASEMMNILEDGKEDVENILNRTNKHMQDAGYTEASEASEYGAGVGKLTDKGRDSLFNSASAKKVAKDTIPEGRPDLVVQALIMLAKSVGNSEVVSMLMSSRGTLEKTETKSDVKTSSKTWDEEVRFNSEDISADFSGNSTDSSSSGSDVNISSEREESEEMLDGKDALEELLSSL